MGFRCKLTQKKVEGNKKDTGEEEAGVGEKATYWLFPSCGSDWKKKWEQRFPYLENYLLEVNVLDILQQSEVKGNHLKNFLKILYLKTQILTVKL